jgi:hypothetical protein
MVILVSTERWPIHGVEPDDLAVNYGLIGTETGRSNQDWPQPPKPSPLPRLRVQAIRSPEILSDNAAYHFSFEPAWRRL